MEIRILGPLQVRGSDGLLTVPGGRAASLLALLALRSRTVMSTDRLIEELWGEAPPPTARTKVQGLVSTLRKHLGRDLLKTDATGYLLELDPLHVDAHLFRQLVESSVQMSAEEKERSLTSALVLWRGDALEDFTYEPFAQDEIRRLEDLRLQAMEGRIEARLILGRHHEVVPELQTLVTAHPLRERLTALLMTALYRSSRQAEALAAYRSLANNLVEKLGIDPAPDLQKLEADILSQNPNLMLAPAETDAVSSSGWLPQHRRPVTVIFISLDAPYDDPELGRSVVSQARKLLAATIERHGGSVKGFLGDTTVAVFGLPTAHEDDALRAARAALALRTSLTGTRSIGHRIGIDSGEVLVGDTDVQPSGAAVSVANRLHQLASVGQILIGGTTRRTLGDGAVTRPTSGEDDWGHDPPAWELVDLVTPRAEESVLVGRDHELRDLRRLLNQVAHGGTPLTVQVVGEAGVGKTSLVREFTRSVAPGVSTLTGHCPVYGEGITF